MIEILKSNTHKWFVSKLLEWYSIEKRHLPWRETQDPYLIWLSEIILQQTRVSQGLPYFERITKKFPTVFDLAKASEEEVLKLWEGLGYYSRARNMHHCANQVLETYSGKFPETYEELLKLKGVGKYTAAAIASFAFDQVVPVVDGNVYRLLSRIFGIRDDITEPKTFNIFFNYAKELIPNEHPGDFNQAMMEFGALQCTPKTPNCSDCCFNQECHALKHDLVSALPVKTKKTKVVNRYMFYLIIEHNGSYLVRNRTEADIWKGLNDFPSIEYESQKELSDIKKDVVQAIPESYVKNGCTISNEHRHLLSHRKILARFIHIELEEFSQLQSLSKKFSASVVNYDEMLNLPKPVLISNYLKTGFFSLDLIKF